MRRFVPCKKNMSDFLDFSERLFGSCANGSARRYATASCANMLCRHERVCLDAEQKIKAKEKRKRIQES